MNFPMALLASQSICAMLIEQHHHPRSNASPMGKFHSIEMRHMPSFSENEEGVPKMPDCGNERGALRDGEGLFLGCCGE